MEPTGRGVRPFEVRHGGRVLLAYDPAYYTTADMVVADMVRRLDDRSTSPFGPVSGFEVWRGGMIVATARRDDRSGAFVPGPPPDRSGGIGSGPPGPSG